tara:strand:+ start:219 stop:701 length:483 start_codon:yes stop_codon:yes gene_type:complete
MTGQINVNKIAARTGNTITVASGDVLQAPGHVLQVVEGTYDTQTDVAGSSYADSGLSVAITPSSTSSKILAIINVHCFNNGTGLIGLNIVRGSTQIVESTYAHGYDDNAASMTVLTKLDSPNTTSATTYKVQTKISTGSGTLRINQTTGGSRITLLEIAG